MDVEIFIVQLKLVISSVISPYVIIKETKPEGEVKPCKV